MDSSKDSKPNAESKLPRKGSPAPTQPSQIKRRVRATAAVKRKVKSVPGKRGTTNETDPMARKADLEQDPWAAGVTPSTVTCAGCCKPIKLDVRSGGYYRSNWTKHKRHCKVISGVKNKGEAEAEDYDVDNKVDKMDVDEEDTAVLTSRPFILNQTSGQSPASPQSESPYTKAAECRGRIPPRLAFKGALLEEVMMETIQMDSEMMEPGQLPPRFMCRYKSASPTLYLLGSAGMDFPPSPFLLNDSESE
ncbi:hypothetical protein DXG01_016824 [Tephrocybe rancida]|nr:hypothetical protein DXG01_016824 [Tephrocybe rancida]